MATTEQFSLRWNNFHSNLTSGFHDLLQAADMVDVTLAVEGQFLQAHKIVLSICSPYFKQMFKINPCKHPIVILKDVAHENMKDILEFMYLGEVNVLRENLPSFLRTAELLQVKGLTGDDSQSETSSKKDEKLDSIGDGDDEQDYNQLIEAEAAMFTPTTVSTPLVQKPQSNTKRQAKNSLNNATMKKTKTETNQSKNSSQANKVKNENCKVDDEGQVDASTNIKLEMPYETDEPAKEIGKSYDSNNMMMNLDSNPQDNDVVMYTVDEKGHAYCPYCFKKFVNRYNLKVHIRDKHDTSSLNLDCLICGKTMRNKSCLRVHMYHHRKQDQAKATL